MFGKAFGFEAFSFSMTEKLMMAPSRYWRIKLANWDLHVTVRSGHATSLGAIPS
jgi:hypothetical protein